MTAKIYNCEALFLARMENTLLNNKLVLAIACDNGIQDTTKTIFYLTIKTIDEISLDMGKNKITIRLKYSTEDYKTYESRLLVFFREAFELLGNYSIEETMDK